VVSPYRVRIRVHVAGVLVDDQVFDALGGADVVEHLATAHGAAVHLADVAGDRWVIDFEFWDGQHVRFGTDPSAMVLPLPMALTALMEHLSAIPETP
jgi:hypothetical protein